MAIFTVFNNITRIALGARLEAEHIATIFGDVRLDLTQMQLEPGDHTVRILALFGDIKLSLPEQIGLRIDATTLCSDAEAVTRAAWRLGGNWISDNFDRAPVRMRVFMQGLLGDIDILRLPADDIIAPVDG